MARINGHRQEKMTLELMKVLLVFNILSLYRQLTGAVESHGQVFIQTDTELRYVVDGVPLQVLPGQRLPDIKDEGGTASNVRFNPAMLDFDKQHVGMPVMEQVTVQNPDAINSLHLLSISGSTQHFHCSFFQDKLVPPGGNTTFEVVFLAREVGNVENTLYIHTSHGTYKYQVFGVGIPNPYRLRPFLRARVPLNTSYSPLIQMHNPYSKTLQVTEMFSSGGDLHLELPTGESEAPKKLWEIQPYETKPVMRASFVGRTEQNHTAYIRIKTDQDDRQQLVLPIEVEVSSSPGLYAPAEVLDFGILRTLDSPKSLKLKLINSCLKAVHLTSVSVVPPNDAISVEFRPIKVQANLHRPMSIGTLTFTASRTVNPKQWTGKIVVKSKNSQHKLSIPYRADVLHGSLLYNASNLRFHVGKSPFLNMTRNLTLTNTFNVSVVIYNVSLPDDVLQYFTILNFTAPVILRPGQTVRLFVLTFLPDKVDLHFSVPLTLYTNASAFHLPVIIYNGKLKLVHHRPEIYEGQLDFGTLGVDEERSMTFTLRNDNPVDLVISQYRANLRKTTLELLGVEKGNGTALSRKHNVSEIQKEPLILKPYHFAVFSVNLVAPDYEATFAADIRIVTQFQILYIPMTLRTAEGSIQAVPEKIVFDNVYPSVVILTLNSNSYVDKVIEQITFKVLKLRSSFDTYMEVEKVYFQPNDSRFYWEPPKNSPIMLEPRQDTIVGKLYFDAKKECMEDCYVGLSTNNPVGQQWLLGLALNKDVADIDQYLYARYHQKWEILGLTEQTTVNVTVQIDISDIRGFLFPAQVHFQWPSFIPRYTPPLKRFPLTQIGNSSSVDIEVGNPTDAGTVVQMVLLASYPNPQTIIDMMSSRLAEYLTDYIETEDEDIFKLEDLEENNDPLVKSNAVARFRREIEVNLEVKTHNKSIPIWMPEHRRYLLKIGFYPKDDIPRTTLFIIRNNVTIIDALVLHGQGAFGELRLSNQRAESATPLLFELNKTHLQNCEKKKQHKLSMPNFTVKRAFTVKNTGELQVFVHGFSINDRSCEGYGFRVLNCDPFNLRPGETKKIEVAFTPDFTMSRIRQVLSIHSSIGSTLNYTLQATLPPHMLSKCSMSLPRPPWEPVVYYSCVSVMGFFLFVILLYTYIESDRIFQADILLNNRLLTNGQFDRSKIFDLKRITAMASSKSCKDGKLSNHFPLNFPNGKVDAKDKKENSSLAANNTKNTSLKVETIKASYERQGSREKELKQNKIQLDKVNLLTNGNDHKNDGKQRTRQKLGKRYSGELVSTNFEERKNKDNLIDKKKGNDSDTKLLEKTNNDNRINNKSNKENGKSDTDIAMLTNNLVDVEIPKKEGKKKLKHKSKAMIRREEKERRELEKKQRKELVELDKDETSSTTTDTSSVDNEDKNSSAGCSTPEPLQPKPKTLKLKTKSKTKKTCINDLLLVEPHQEEGFEDHGKVKAKKSKMEKNLLDCSLSLPYSPHKENLKHDAKEVPSSPHTIAAEATIKVATKKTTKANRLNRHKSNAQSLLFDTDSSDMGKESPPPLWDMPKPLPSPEDLSDLAFQTHQFEINHGKHLNYNRPLDSATNPSPSGSFSSIVSSNSSGGDLPNKVNNIVPESRKPLTSAFMTLGDLRPTGASPGPVGSRIQPPPWNTSPGSMISTDVGPFHLGPIKEQNNSWNDKPSPPAYVKPGLSGSGPFEQPTMMQRLQADRRRRLLEYQQKLMKGDDWPGFNINPVQPAESLWDAQFAPREQWSTITDSPPKTTVSGLWGGLSEAANNSWDSVSSIWANAGSADSSRLLESANGVESLEASVEEATNQELGGFDPFNALGNIWRPSASGGSGWGFSKQDKE